MAAYDENLCRFEQALSYRLYRAFCPTSDDLLAFSQRIANPERYVAIANHLSECANCRTELALLEQLSNSPILISELLFI